MVRKKRSARLIFQVCVYVCVRVLTPASSLQCDVGTTGQKSISRVIDYLEHC